MNLKLYNKYGDYNKDGYFILDHEKWDFYAKRPNLYKRKKKKALVLCWIPMVGIIFMDLLFEEMGLSLI